MAKPPKPQISEFGILGQVDNVTADAEAPVMFNYPSEEMPRD